MATVDILIRAKEMVGAGLRAAERKVKDFSNEIHNIGKHTAMARSAISAMATAAVAAGAAIAGAMAKSLSAYMESEVAVNRLRSAHQAWGDEVDRNIEREREFADVMMKKTNVDDESIITSMADLRMMGMRTEALEEGAQAVIAMTRAGAGEEGAARLVMMAYQGQYEKLARYIPALKTATSEAEKASIVNAFLSRQMQAQQAETGTLAGQWKALKINSSEAMEKIGASIANSGVVQAGLKNVSTMVDKIGEGIAGWVSGGGLDVFVGTLRNMGSVLTMGAIDSSTVRARKDEQERKQTEVDPRVQLQARLYAQRAANEQMAAEEKRFAVEMIKLKEGRASIDGETDSRIDATKQALDSEIAAAKTAHDARMAKIRAELAARMAANTGAGTGGEVVKLAVAGTDPAIAERAKRIETAKIEATERMKQQVALFEAERAAKEANLSFDETAEAKVANLKITMEIEAAKQGHDARMAAIKDEAAAIIEANKESNDEAAKAAKAEIDAAAKAAEVRIRSHEAVQSMVESLLAKQLSVERDLVRVAAEKGEQEKRDQALGELDRKKAFFQERAAQVDKWSEERKAGQEGPRQFKARMRDEEAAARKKVDDEKRFADLIKQKGKMGLTLSKEQLAWMKDQEALREKEMLGANINAVEAVRADLQKRDTEASEALLKEQKDINAALQQLLVMR
jgi:hypothetical protein